MLTPPEHPRRRTIVIVPPNRWRLPDVRGLWESREVFLRFGQRDLTLRYRQTLLGVVWVVLQPLLTAAVFTLVFRRVAHVSSGGVPYFLFAYVSMLAWNAFSGTITRGSGSLVQNANLVSKVFFPRILVPLSTLYSVAVDLLVGLALLVVLLAVYGVFPGVALLLAPVWILLIGLLAAGVTTVVAALTVKYRDMQYIVPFVLQLLLFASPIAYATPSHDRWIYDANPLTWLLGEFRWSLIHAHQSLPPTWQVAASVAVPVVVFLGAATLFERMERQMADII